ncbi:MAG: lytic transglycosylase domain-containing protein [Patulibacter sp.]
MSIGAGAIDAAARIAAIQQLVAQLDGTVSTATPAGDFSAALSSAQRTTQTATPATVAANLSGVPYASEITAAATKYDLDPALLAGLVKQESGFDPSIRSAAGATGLTQLMPATAKALGVTDATDPAQSLEGGAKYLREQLDRFGGDERLALAAYNAGPGAVQRYGGIPPYPETQHYVTAVLANRDTYAATADAAATTAVGLGGAGGTSLAALTAANGSNLTGTIAPSTGLTLLRTALDSPSRSSASASSFGLGYPTT